MILEIVRMKFLDTLGFNIFGTLLCTIFIVIDYNDPKASSVALLLDVLFTAVFAYLAVSSKE